MVALSNMKLSEHQIGKKLKVSKTIVHVIEKSKINELLQIEKNKTS